MHLLYTTMPGPVAAQEFAARIVDDKLAACVNILPEIISIYAWEEETRLEPEVGLLIKTTVEQIPALEEFFTTHHPYDTPAFVHWPAGASEGFGEWVKAQTR